MILRTTAAMVRCNPDASIIVTFSVLHEEPVTVDISAYVAPLTRDLMIALCDQQVLLEEAR